MRGLLSRYSAVFQADSGSGSGTSSSSPPSTPTASPSPATSSPSPSPTSPGGSGEGESFSPSGSEAGEAGEAQQDFSFIFDPIEDAEIGSPSSPPEVVPEVKPPVAKVTEAPKPAAVPKVETPTAPAPTEPTSTPAAAPERAVGALDPFDPGALAYALQQNESAAIQHVADTLFKLSNEEIEALENDTVSAIPRLLAKGMVKGQLNMLQQLSRMIPTMIQRHGEVTQRHAANESKFYARWPDLKAEVHGPLVLKYGAVYRQMHPDATLESMIEDLGPMVMMAAKVVPGNGNHGTRATPAPRRGVPSPPFTPAGAVAAGAVPQQTQDMSAIESMFMSPDD